MDELLMSAPISGAWHADEKSCAATQMSKTAMTTMMNNVSFRDTSRSLPLKLSMKAFCTDFPGAIQCQPTLT